MTAVLKERSTF